MKLQNLTLAKIQFLEIKFIKNKKEKKVKKKAKIVNWAWSNQIVHHSAVFFLRLYAQVKEVKSFTSVTSFEVHQKGIARLKKVLKLQP